MPAIVERDRESESDEEKGRDTARYASRHRRESSGDVESGPTGSRSNFAFNSTSIRNGFIRKVFALVSVMLLVTALITAIPYMHQDVRRFVRHSLALYISAWLVFLVVYIAIVCCEKVRRSYPVNLVCLGILTLSIGVLTMCICAYHDIISVLLCLLITTICCAGIIVFAIQTKYDLTSMIGILFLCSLVVFVFGIVAIIAAVVFKVRWLYTVYAGIAAILFMAYLAVDIQMVMGGRKYEISPEEYIFAAVTIFVDIVYIFWMLLGVVGSVSNN